MRAHLEAAVDEELARRDVRRVLKQAALRMANEGLGSVVLDRARPRWSHYLLSQRDVVEPDSPAAAGALNRARYALTHYEDLGAGTLARAVADLWREGGGTCAPSRIPEAQLVHDLMAGPMGGGRQQAGRLLALGCGSLGSASAPVVVHALSLHEVMRRLRPKEHEYRPVGAKLADAELSGLDLRGAQFVDADLKEADLTGSDLSGANLSGAQLGAADLRSARLVNANLHGANLNGTIAVDADLSGADLSNARVMNASLRRTRLVGANLSNADLRRAKLHEADLTYTNLIGTDLTEAVTDDADFTNAKRNGRVSNIPGWVIDGGVLRRSEPW